MASVEEITVDIIAKNMTLQQAVTILQSEFSKKADWYDALGQASTVFFGKRAVST